MKIKLKNRTINEDGIVIQNSESLFESLFVNPNAINNSYSEDTQDIQEYNKWAKIYNYPKIKTQIEEINHNSRQGLWSIPTKYKDLDIESYILNLCMSDQDKFRVIYELKEYKQRNLYSLLRYMVYLRDVIKENNIIIGVGRGSSVSSYILFLLGIHRVNSLKYILEIKEFLK